MLIYGTSELASEGFQEARRLRASKLGSRSFGLALDAVSPYRLVRLNSSLQLNTTFGYLSVLCSGPVEGGL